MSQSHQAGAWTSGSAQEALREVLARAGTDPAFRELCLKSPSEAVKAATERELPEGFRLQLVDNAGADLTVVLPDMIATAELSDSELEAVSGGIKCLVGSCGATEVCGVTDPCVVSKSDGGAGSPKGKGRGQ